MSDQGDENLSRQEGADGGVSSGDETFDDYELVAEEENVDTTWESSEVHPERHYPRSAYGFTGSYPEVPPPRIVLTDGPSMSPKRARGVQTEPLVEHERARQKPDEQAATSAEPRPAQEQPQPDEQAAALGPTTSQEQPQQERPPLHRRLKNTLQRMRLRSSSSRGESPHKSPRDESPPSTKQ